MSGVADYSKTPASNIAINAIGIAGTNSPANFDNALRQYMADIATAREDGALASMPYATKSSGYTLALTDRGKLIECTAALEIELLAAASATGFYFIAKANGGAVTLDPNGSENINGSSTSLVVADGSSAIVACNGTAWFTVTVSSFTNLPASNDAAALGASGTAWSDLFLASGGVINWDAGDVTITHSAGALTFGGASSGYTFDAALSIGTSAAMTAGTVELGHASDTTLSRSAAGVIAVEGVPLYSGIPITDKSAAYTLVLADRQTAIRHPAADNNARTFTIDSNANVAYAIGTVLTFINEINTVTIAITSDTLVLANTGTTGSRTLAANGIATAIKVAATRWYISGVGLT